MTEEEKMDQALWYDANDKTLLQQRQQAEALCFQLNQTPPQNEAARQALLRALLPHLGEEVTILSPFFTDYGSRCFIGAHTFFNHNIYLMDGGTITLGAHCFIGPNCGFYTANHPLLPAARNQGLEQARPIVLGDHVWLGGGVTVLGGVTIGEGAVIGAGSVVTKDIPPYVLAAGNPCRVLRPLTDADTLPFGDESH